MAYILTNSPTTRDEGPTEAEASAPTGEANAICGSWFDYRRSRRIYLMCTTQRGLMRESGHD